LGLRGQRRIVGYQDEGYVVLAVEVFHQVEYMLAVFGVEISGRFVGEQYLWRVGKGAGDGDTLLFAARELGRVMVAAIDQVDLSEKLVGPRPNVRQAEYSPSG
jgi:hypothetical protein